MSRTVSRTIEGTSTKSAFVEISPRTMTRPVVVAVSHATRAWGAARMNASRIASETWSQSLSGWPSVTDSDVNRYCDASTMLVMDLLCDVRAEGITGLPALHGALRCQTAPGPLGTASTDHRGIPVARSTIQSATMPARRPARAARVVAAFAATLFLGALASSPALAADRNLGGPSGTTIQPFERTRTVDLFRANAAVTQFTNYWCVPAATQTMINLVQGTTDRSYATQSRLYRELRAANLYRYSTRGNDVRGWARVLSTHLGPGRTYGDRSFTSQAAAYVAIVDSMTKTKRPVGIVVDRGTHAWTIVGFKVHETVGVRGSRTILGFYVVGPLGSPRDPWPKSFYTVAQLSARFTRYHESTRSVIWAGKYVIVQPLEATGAISAGR